MLDVLIVAFSFIGFLKSVILFLFFACALLMTLIILLQEPKGGGLAAAFGGAGAETFGVQSGGVNRFTTGLAVAFMVLAILYASIRPDAAGGTAPSDEPDTELVAPPEDAGGETGAPEGTGD